MYNYVYISYIYIYVYTGEGNGNPHQYSCLDNFMDGSLVGSLGGFKELNTTED